MRMTGDRLNLSALYRERAFSVIPGGSQTFSKAPQMFVQGVAPAFLERGSGSHVWDVDGNEYIDYILGLGPILLGYVFSDIERAIESQLERGMVFSLPHPLEVELAEKLVEVIPCAEMVRFGKNGSDATSGAIRLARHVTGRKYVLCCGYHGWQDWYVGTTSRAHGVPNDIRRLTKPFAYNDFQNVSDLFSKYRDDIACVIMEPVGVEPPEEGFLEYVRDITSDNGSILIFDEVVTGFRFALGGAQEYFGVTPDLACFGKGLGNGMPISCIAGPRELMQEFDTVFFSFTFGGETLSLAASLAVLEFMEKEKVIEKLWDTGQALKDKTTSLISRHGLEDFMECVGYAPRTIITFQHPEMDPLVLKTLWQQEVIAEGILSNANHNICYSHDENDVEFTLGIYDKTLGRIKSHIEAGSIAEALKGPVLKPVFRRH